MSAGRLLSWGMPLLYTGPAFELPPHRKGVGLFCVSLDGHMNIEIGDGDERRRVFCESAYIDHGVPHHITFHARTIACLYMDPQSSLSRSVTAEMHADGRGVFIAHQRQSAIIDTLVDDRPLVRRDRIAEVFGLPDSLAQEFEPRLRAVAQAILTEPAEPHRVKEFARRSRLSESRLRHAFRDAAGVPLRRFRLWTRMGAALHLIGGGATLTRAAHEAGFSSSAHFSSAYRAMFGIKPSVVVGANPMLRPPGNGSHARPSRRLVASAASSG